MKIRHATIQDLDEITAVEARCFPEAEAATRDSFQKRLEVYPDYFWLLEKDNQIIAIINGLVTDEPKLKDEMYADAGFHNEQGAWQMIFGVETLPEYQGCGYAGLLMRQVIADAGAQGRRGLVLTCKDKLKGFYESFGFVDEGASESTHGGALWYEMRLTF